MVKPDPKHVAESALAAQAGESTSCPPHSQDGAIVARSPNPTARGARLRPKLDNWTDLHPTSLGLIQAGANQRFCVALSGGLDSVVLLHLLHAAQSQIGFKLSALHVHHGLSPNADQWTAFCIGLCHELGVPLQVERVQVAQDLGQGVEASARAARYGAFSRCAADYVVLAHHGDDQTETLLLNLLRGAGVHGAAAMPVERALHPIGPRLLRPLLALSRESLAVWAQQRQLAWIEDESNQDSSYSRNFLRHGVLPLLKERFPGSDRAMQRAARHFAESASLLDEMAAQDLAQAAVGDGLRISVLASLSEARARNLLRFWLRIQGGMAPDSDALEEALRQLFAARPEAQLAVPLGRGMELRRHRGLAYAVRPLPTPEPRLWLGEESLLWAGGVLHFRACVGQGVKASLLLPGQTRIRSRGPGDRLKINVGQPTRTLKNLLQEYSLPYWLRSIIPCVESPHGLLWVGPLGTAWNARCEDGEAGIVMEWVRSPPESNAPI